MLSFFKHCIIEAYKDLLKAVRDKAYYVMTAEYCPQPVFFISYRVWRKLDNCLSDEA